MTLKKSAKSKTAKSADTSTPATPDTPRFPIVGIGASAGGLEALELFLKNVPPNCGMAFVIVQHLDPTHKKGIMVELLQRTTAMPVAQVTDRMKIKPDHVYVIPPNRDFSILHGVLHLLEPVAPRGLHLPIDFFLRSLAEDQQEHSIGVILSGMGSDGTLGLVKAMKKDFEQEGYEVMTASCGEEAVEMNKSQQFDVIVTDLFMPGMDGIKIVLEK